MRVPRGFQMTTPAQLNCLKWVEPFLLLKRVVLFWGAGKGNHLFHVSGLPLFSRQTQSSAATSRCKLHPFAGQHAVGSTCESLTGSLEPLFQSSHDVSSWWTIQLSEIPLLISAKSISPCQQPSSFGGCSISVVLFIPLQSLRSEKKK